MSPTTFVASCTYTNPDGTAATGRVTFRAINAREANTATVQDAITVVATLDDDGAIAQTLVVNAGGYDVVERIKGSRVTRYAIVGTDDLDLSTVDASTHEQIP